MDISGTVNSTEKTMTSNQTGRTPSASVGISIVNYNGGKRLEACLAALVQQTRQPDRIVLIDNCSKDFDAEDILKKFPAVEVNALDENTGFASANNYAVDLLDDVDWIVLLNPDAYAEPDWLEMFLAGAEKYPEYSSFACRMLAMGGQILDGTGDVYHISGANWRRDFGNPADRRLKGDEIFSPSGAAALIKREVYLEAGGLNDDFFCYMEDVDLGFRMQLLGYRCRYIPEARVIHEGSALVGKHSDFQVYYGHRNMLWVYVMNMPAPWVWVYLPQHLLYNAASILLFILRGQAAVILRAKYHAIKGLGRALKRRGEIQAGARIMSSVLRQRLSHGWLAPYLYRKK